MNHSSDGKRHCTNGYRQSDVRRRHARRVAQSEVFIPDMRRVRNAADQPRRQSPYMNVVGGPGKASANEKVDDADKYCRAKPWLAT
jgi:hypothetical protein